MPETVIEKRKHIGSKTVPQKQKRIRAPGIGEIVFFGRIVPELKFPGQKRLFILSLVVRNKGRAEKLQVPFGMGIRS